MARPIENYLRLFSSLLTGRIYEDNYNNLVKDVIMLLCYDLMQFRFSVYAKVVLTGSVFGFSVIVTTLSFFLSKQSNFSLYLSGSSRTLMVNQVLLLITVLLGWLNDQNQDWMLRNVLCSDVKAEVRKGGRSIFTLFCRNFNQILVSSTTNLWQTHNLKQFQIPLKWNTARHLAPPFLDNFFFTC